MITQDWVTMLQYLPPTLKAHEVNKDHVWE